MFKLLICDNLSQQEKANIVTKLVKAKIVPEVILSSSLHYVLFFKNVPRPSTILQKVKLEIGRCEFIFSWK